jgi:hypothetical protein
MSTPLEVGKYYMKGEGTCVRISEARDGGERGTVFAVEYVQPPTGASIMGGGSSFFWDAKNFTPITDPLWLAASKGHDALCRINSCKAALGAAERDYATYCRVVGVIIEAAKNTGCQ